MDHCEFSVFRFGKIVDEIFKLKEIRGFIKIFNSWAGG